MVWRACAPLQKCTRYIPSNTLLGYLEASPFVPTEKCGTKFTWGISLRWFLLHFFLLHGFCTLQA